MAEFKYKVFLQTERTYLATINADSEEEACEILNDECWEWDDNGLGENVDVTSSDYDSNTIYTLIEETK